MEDLPMELRVAIYCRLSKEDEEKGQSESIKNQQSSLISYTKEKGWRIVDCYLDDGYSGTSFERPAFQRMIRDIEKGLVDCVITKDYSRLGREHIQTSYYTEIFFPQYAVRYIAVNDNIDTSQNDDFLSIRAVFNDMYARDISKKIRYSLRNKQREGAFIGAFAPYGYKKDHHNRNRLVIDWATAPIIREIFQLYLEGYGKSRIATLLNKKGIPSPASVKLSYRNSRQKTRLWSPIAVKRILENEVYLGHTVQRKKEKISYKINKQISLPKEIWIKVEDTHPPLIEKEVFKKIQQIKKERQELGFFTGKNPGLFSGLVKCGLCNSNYLYSTDKKYGRILLCGTYKRYYSRGCQKIVLPEIKLEELISTSLKDFFKTVIDKNILLIKLQKIINEQKDNQLEEIQVLEKKSKELENKFNTLYQDRLNSLLSQEQFNFFKCRLEDENGSLKSRIEVLKERKSKLKQKDKRIKLEELFKNFLTLKNLDRNLILRLIDKIEVVSHSKIRVTYKFKPP